MQVMVRSNDQTPLAGQRTQHLRERLRTRYIQPGEGLIEQQDMSFLRQCPSQKTALLLAPG